jgi:spoIIIJ-associated protein
MRIVEKAGKTLKAAVAAACEELNCSEEQLEVEVISKGTGLLRLIGGEKVRIRAKLKEETFASGEQNLSPDPGPQEVSMKEENDEAQETVGDKAKGFLEGILKHMGMETSVTMEETPEQIILKIKGDGSGILIGKRGRTLDALQYLVNKVVGKSSSSAAGGKRVVVDSEQYRKRREESLRHMAFQMAEKARNQGKPIMLENMSPRDRRIIHLALDELEGIKTESKGQGSERRLIIYPV